MIIYLIFFWLFFSSPIFVYSGLFDYNPILLSFICILTLSAYLFFKNINKIKIDKIVFSISLLIIIVLLIHSIYFNNYEANLQFIFQILGFTFISIFIKSNILSCKKNFNIFSNISFDCYFVIHYRINFKFINRP